MDTKTEPIHAEVVVELTSVDGNSFSIMAAVRKALIDAGFPSDASNFVKEAWDNGNATRDHLLQTCMKWVTVR